MYTRLVMLLDTFVVKRGSICKVYIVGDRVCIENGLTCRPKANRSE